MPKLIRRNLMIKLKKLAVFVTLIALTLGLNKTANALTLPTPNKIHNIAGANGVNIAVQEWGNAKGKTIIFSHAWSLNHTAWLPQFTSDLANDFRIITYDLRGHGNSDKPKAPENYSSDEFWADDLNAIITSLNLNKVTLVGWSYSSVIIADYIKKYGQDRIHAINFNASLSGLGIERIGKYFGNEFDPVMATSKLAEIEALGMMNITNIMVPKSLDKNTYGMLIAATMATPKYVRSAMLDRKIDHKETYQMIKVPVLFSHGTKDGAIKPIAAEEGASFVKNGKLSLYEGANHGPNWADPKRFNAELRALINSKR